MPKGEKGERFLMSNRTIRVYDIQPIPKAQRAEEKVLGDILNRIEFLGLGPAGKRGRR